MVPGFALRVRDHWWTGSADVHQKGARMAYDPCDCHAASFRGKSNFAYPAGITGGRRYGGRVRLCPAGQESLLGSARRHLDEIVPGGNGRVHEQPVCGWCGTVGPEEPTTRIYLTAYRDHKDQLDFSGWACPTCVDQAESELILRPFAAR